MEQDLLTQAADPQPQAAVRQKKGRTVRKDEPSQGSGAPDAGIADADIFQQLLFLQQNICAGKTERNESEGFQYRSEDGILSALKPLLGRCRCIVTFRDEVVRLADGYIYLKTTCSLVNSSGQSTEAPGYAREDLVLPGKCQAMITGSCSTYAHKYALKSLLLLTDEPVKDPGDPDAGCYRDPLEMRRRDAQMQEKSDDAKPGAPAADVHKRPALVPAAADPKPIAAVSRVELVPGSREFNSTVMRVVQQKGEHTFEQYGEWIRKAYDISDENLRLLLSKAGRRF